MRFRDRVEAGKLLSRELLFLQDNSEVIVLGIPRGGVVVAYQIAQALRAPLDVYITRKIGAPSNPELAIGAVSGDGQVVLDGEIVRYLDVSPDYIRAETARQRAEIARRLAAYRGERPVLQLAEKTVILADDGVATGATTLAALRALRQHAVRQLILAIPVGPPDTVAKLRAEADRVICLYMPSPFWAVGMFYVDFTQTTDAEVVALLAQAEGEREGGGG